MNKLRILQGVLINCAPSRAFSNYGDLSADLTPAARSRYNALAAQIDERLSQFADRVGGYVVDLCLVAQDGITGKAIAHLVRDELGYGVRVVLNQPNAPIPVLDEDPDVAVGLGMVRPHNHAEDTPLIGQHLAEMHLLSHALDGLAQAAQISVN